LWYPALVRCATCGAAMALGDGKLAGVKKKAQGFGALIA
jgi:hypothetical protein